MSLHYGGRGPGHLSRWPKGAGVWNLANWYAADPTRYTTTPWYETDKAYLFQDVLAATPVTAPGDPVRLVKAKNGNTNHDLLIHTTGSPATYRERSGVGYVEHNGAALQMRGTATMSLPFFILGAHARPGRVAQGSLFGLYKASNQFLTLWDAGSTQNRISTRSREAVSGPVLKNSQGAFRQSPLSAPQVLDSLFKAGYQDIGVNGQARFTDTNTWTGSEAVTGAELGTNLNGASAPFSNVHDFYGGWAYWGDPGEDLRQNVVNYFRRKIERPLASSDFNILMVSDSTGDDTNETAGTVTTTGDWPYHFADYLADENPTKFVGIRVFEDTEHRALGYRPEIVIQDETSGGGAIRIFDGAIAGSQPQQALGLDYTKMIGQVPTPDVIFINHGYNPIASGDTITSYTGRMIGLIEELKAVHPAVPIFLLRQPRLSVGTSMDAWVSAMDTVAALYGDIMLVDVWQKFRDLNEDASLYADGTHPSTLGVVEYLEAVTEAWEANQPLPTTASAGFYPTTATSFLSNGRFSSWSGGLPVGWTKTGSGTVTQDATVVDSGDPSSVLIDDTNSTSTYIEQAINAIPHRGLTMSLAVRRHITEAGLTADFVTAMHVITNGTGGQTNTFSTLQKSAGRSQLAVLCVPVPADATTITVRLYGRVSGTSPCTVRYGRVSLVDGAVPHEAA